MKILKIIIVIVLIIVSFIAGNTFNNSNSHTLSIVSCNNEYKYLNASTNCNIPQIISKQLYTDFVKELNIYVNTQKKENNASHVSVYFRDLVSGPTFGIEEKESFAPASLLKVPLLFSYLSAFESDDTILDQKITFQGDAKVLQQTSSQSSKLERGKSYTVANLLKNMIVESDNLSYLILYKSLDNISLTDRTLELTMVELGLVSPRTPTEDTITVKSYASLFRQLYNASYLSPKSSEYAIELLLQSSYKKGLVAGLPQNIKVAHKFGERSGFNSEEKQLHDCGIIYYPNNPYLLCIMTRGNDMKKLERIISEISRLTYKEVNSRSIKH